MGRESLARMGYVGGNSSESRPGVERALVRERAPPWIWAGRPDPRVCAGRYVGGNDSNVPSREDPHYQTK